MQKINKFIPINKVDDEQRMVWGYASTPDLDSDGEVIEIGAIEKALPEYMKFPTIREMHQPKAAGRTVEASVDNKGLFIGAKIISEEAWKMVKEGVYAGFSVGGRVKQKIRNTITELSLSEISLVDVPANKSAVITLWKSDGENNHPLIVALREIDFKPGSIEDKLREGVIRVAEEKIAETVEEVEEQEVEETEETEEAEEVEEAEAQEDETAESEDEDAEANAEAEEVEDTADDEGDAEVVVDEAKDASDQPSDIQKTLNSLLTKISSLEEKLAEKKEVTKADEADLVKTDYVKSLEERIEKLESQPMPAKAKASYTSVEKTFSKNDGEEVVENSRLDEINKRLAEIDDIKTKDIADYQHNYMSEAMDLVDEKQQLLRTTGREGVRS